MLVRKTIVSVLLSVSLAPLAAEQAALRWIELPSPQLEVNGLPWYGENSDTVLKTRKLLILRNGKTAENATSAKVRYTAGTRGLNSEVKFLVSGRR